MNARCMFREVAAGVFLHAVFVAAFSAGGETVNENDPDMWRQRNDDHRREGRVIVTEGVLTRAGRHSVFVTGENRYGRLRNRHVITVVASE